MKNFLFIIALIIISSIIMASSIEGPFIPGSGSWNIINNGSFENGLTDWAAVSTGTGVFSASTDKSVSGSYSAKFTPVINFSGPGYAIVQTISVTAGQTYVLSGFFNQGTMTGSHAYLDLNDTSFDVTAGVSFTSEVKEDWIFIWETVTIPTNVSSVTIRAVNDSNMIQGQYAYIDDISFTLLDQFSTATVVPELSNFLIFSISFAMLLFVKIKI